MSFNLAPGVALGDAVSKVERAMRDMGVPATIRGSFQGIAQAFQDSLANQPLLIAAALVTVYIVLGILYESYIHPITILSTLPSAGLGALGSLSVLEHRAEHHRPDRHHLAHRHREKERHHDDRLRARRRASTRARRPVEAIFQACLLRFRPIIMTTMAALLGALPLALGTGTGSELRRPLGITIVGGLILSQLFTLYTTPVVYLYLDRLRAWCMQLRRGVKQDGPLEASRSRAERVH